MVDNKILIQQVFIYHCSENWLSSVVLFMIKVVEVLVSELHVIVAVTLEDDLNRLRNWVGDDLSDGLLVQQMCELLLQLWIFHRLKIGALNHLRKIRLIRYEGPVKRSYVLPFHLAGVDYPIRVPPRHLRQ